jgi:ornithine cyclodeaminase
MKTRNKNMKLITNRQVAELITMEDAISSMWQAFSGMHASAQQARVRTHTDAATLSTMGAVLPDMGIAGVKTYTTINGRFRFVIVLFSTADGAPLAAIEADEMTGLRTAAATAVATNFLARDDARTLSVIGTGIQARAHVPALCSVRKFSQVLVAGMENQVEFAVEVERVTGLPARPVAIDDAVAAADVLLTATRSASPLFAGNLLPEGAFVAAIGASKATVRELDDRAIERAAAVIVEWKPQAREEAGDLVMCKDGLVDWERVLELGDVVSGSASYVRRPSDIVIYKAVGIGLEDVALAGLVYKRACERFGW